MLTGQELHIAFFGIAYGTVVISHFNFSQHLNFNTSWQNAAFVCGQFDVGGVKIAEFNFWRIFEGLIAKIEYHMLEGHETSGRTKSGPRLLKNSSVDIF